MTRHCPNFGDTVLVSAGRFRADYETTITRAARIRTPEMVAADERRRTVTLALKEHGITYERGSFTQPTEVSGADPGRIGVQQMTPADIPLKAIHTHQATFIHQGPTCPQCFRPRTECGGHR